MLWRWIGVELAFGWRGWVPRQLLCRSLLLQSIVYASEMHLDGPARDLTHKLEQERGRRRRRRNCTYTWGRLTTCRYACSRFKNELPDGSWKNVAVLSNRQDMQVVTLCPPEANAGIRPTYVIPLGALKLAPDMHCASWALGWGR